MHAISSIALACIAIAGPWLAACRDIPSAASCEKLFEQTVEFYAAPNGTKALNSDQKAEYQQSVLVMRKKLGPAFVDRCRSQYSPAQVDCQLQARTLSVLTKCWSNQ